MKMHALARLFGALVVFMGMTSLAQAGVYIHPSAMYLEDYKSASGVQTTTRRTLIDLTGGYSFDNGIAIGFIFGTEKQKTIAINTYYTSESEASRSSYGPSLGWITPKNSGPYILASYLTNSDYDALPYSYRGDGFQIDLGFRFAVKSAYMSLQLSYKSFTYKKYTYMTSPTVELSDPMKHRYVDPYFGFFFDF